MGLYADVEREKEIEALHREQLWEVMLSFHFFFSKYGGGILDISMARERYVGEGEQLWKSA